VQWDRPADGLIGAKNRVVVTDWFAAAVVWLLNEPRVVAEHVADDTEEDEGVHAHGNQECHNARLWPFNGDEDALENVQVVLSLMGVCGV